MLGHGVDPACGEVEFLSTVKRRCGAADLFGQGEAALLGVFVCEFNGADGVHTKGDLLCFLRVNGVAVSRDFGGFGLLGCRALGVGFEFLFVGDGLASRNLHGEFFVAAGDIKFVGLVLGSFCAFNVLGDGKLAERLLVVSVLHLNVHLRRVHRNIMGLSQFQVIPSNSAVGFSDVAGGAVGHSDAQRNRCAWFDVFGAGGAVAALVGEGEGSGGFRGVDTRDGLGERDVTSEARVGVYELCFSLFTCLDGDRAGDGGPGFTVAVTCGAAQVLVEGTGVTNRNGQGIDALTVAGYFHGTRHGRSFVVCWIDAAVADVVLLFLELGEVFLVGVVERAVDMYVFGDLQRNSLLGVAVDEFNLGLGVRTNLDIILADGEFRLGETVTRSFSHVFAESTGVTLRNDFSFHWSVRLGRNSLGDLLAV